MNKIITQKFPKNLLVAILCLSSILTANAQKPISTETGSPAPTGSLNTGFIENKGQVHNQLNEPTPDVLYLLNMKGLNVQLRKTGFSYDAWIAEETNAPAPDMNAADASKRPDFKSHNYRFHRVDVDFEGMNNGCDITAENPGSGVLNYYTGDFVNHGLQVHHYAKVVYHNIYPGIDIEFYAKAGSNKPVEYNFIVHPGADPKLIKLRYSGASKTSIEQGKIALQLEHGALYESIPKSWLSETSESVQIEYTTISQTKGSATYGFNAGVHPAQTLIIDPVPDLTWGTYFGDAGYNYVLDIAVDGSGNVFTTGYTESNSIATSGAYQTSYNGSSDAYVAEFNSSGTSLTWCSFYGGSSYEYGWGIALDGNNYVYFTGYTLSTSGIATSGAYQTSIAGNYDLFLAKFSTSGTMQWATYFGGTDYEDGAHLAIDNSGNIFLSGYTSSSSGIATSGAYQTAFGGNTDEFLAKFSASGSLLWSTYIGGSNSDGSWSASVSTDGSNAYVGFLTFSSGLATSGAHQTSNAGNGDMAVAKFNSSGSLQWLTYYGGSDYDECIGLGCDATGNLYITGKTSSTSGIATSGSYQSSNAGSQDICISKFSAAGVQQWGTYFGSYAFDNAYQTVSDNSGNTYFYIDLAANGLASTGAYLTTGNTLIPLLGRFNSNGTFHSATYYGGSNYSLAYGIAADNNGNAYLGGETYSNSGISTSGTYQTSNVSGADAFLAKFLFCSNPEEIDIQGNAVSIVNGDITPALTDSTDFGIVAPGTVRRFSIVNTGSAALTINSISVGGTNSGDFAISGAPTSVAASSSAVFYVTFNPSATGIRAATITIDNSDCDESSYAFDIQAAAASGEALNFDGTDDYVNCGSSTSLVATTGITIEAWVYQTATSSAYKYIVNKEGEYEIAIINGVVEYAIANTSPGWNFISTGITVSASTWTHLAFTYDGSTIKMYKNGTLAYSASGSGNIGDFLPGEDDLQIGQRQHIYQSGTYFNGSIDEVRIWDYARTCSDIKTHMNHELTGSESGLMAYYNFNEGLAAGNNSGITTLPDLTTNANDGTLYNFALTGSTSNWISPGSGASGTTPDADAEIDVTGNSISILDGDLTPSLSDSTDFGLVNTGTVRRFTIVNSGTAALSITNISLGGTNSGDFAISGAPSSVAASSSAVFYVTFNPSVYSTARNATITINNSDCDESAYVFAITATGIQPPPQNTGGAAIFGMRKLGDNYTGPALQIRRSCDNATADIGFTDCGDLDTVALKKFVYEAPALGAIGTSSEAAFSLRNLGCGYSGYAIRVRRSSDNTTQDIGFTSTGDLDTAALKTFVGSSSAYVTIWYDQSGNSRDASQATAANQPRIVNAGVIERQNGKPALRFLSISQGLATASFTAFSSAATFNGVAKVNTNLTYNAIVSKTGSGGNANIPAPIDFYNKRHVVGNGTNYVFYDVPNDFVATKPLSIWTFQAASGGTFDAYYNGAANGSASVGSTFADGGNPLCIGRRADGVTGLNGWISEVLTFSSFPSAADRQYFEYTQALYYGISGPSYATPTTPPSGYVAKWYDQSGNGVDISQSTNSRQPVIVSAGKLITLNGRPAMRGSSVTQTNLTGSFGSNYTGTELTTVAVYQSDTTTTSNLRLVSTGRGTTAPPADWNDNGLFNINQRSSNNLIIERNATSPNIAITTGTGQIVSAVFNGTNRQIFNNGTGSSTVADTRAFNFNTLRLLQSINTSAFEPIEAFTGRISEFYLFNGHYKATSRIILENNAAEYYGITLSNDKFTPVDANYKRNMGGIGFQSSTDSVQHTAFADGFEIADGNSGSNFLKDAGDYIIAARSCAIDPDLSTSNINTSQGIIQRWLTDWEVKKTDANSNGGYVKFIFSFNDYWNGAPPVMPGVPGQYVLLQRSTSNGTFDTLAVASKSVSGDKVIFIVNSTSINTFFTLGTLNQSLSPLPVQWLKARADWKVNNALVTWTVAEETLHTQYDVQRSFDGQHFTTAGTVQGRAETEGQYSQIAYSFNDRNVREKTSYAVYYRIVAHEEDGSNSSSATMVLINHNTADASVTIAPNPASTQVTVVSNLEPGVNYTIVMRSTTGAEVSTTESGTDHDGHFASMLDVSRLNPGVYIVEVYGNGYHHAEKLIKR